MAYCGSVTIIKRPDIPAVLKQVSLLFLSLFLVRDLTSLRVLARGNTEKLVTITEQIFFLCSAVEKAVREMVCPHPKAESTT